MNDKDKITGNRLEWHDDMPYSTAFGDHFYSKADGRAECGHVFLGGNGLPQRWTEGRSFTIAELGFGTGLNFLETVRVWRQAASGGRLTFVSFEQFPLAAAEMRRALAVWPELAPITERLCADWPAHQSGTVHLDFDGDVALTVHVGDARRRVPAWSGTADAWFLDGFAPARNAEMWSQDLMEAVFAHTRPGGTFSTYTAAGWVRRNLQDAGFNVQKVKGFAGKREMLCGKRLPAQE